MTDPAAPLITVRGVTKDYRSLRPLRVQQLDVREGQSIALLGFDQAMGEVLVNLLTGASVPDSGNVAVLGRSTTEIVNHEEWLQILDQLGLISERAVLVEPLTVEQNLALPLSLDLDELSDALRRRVRTIAAEVGLSSDDLPKPTGTLTPLGRARLRLGRALALGPRVLLAEHPNATVPPDEVAELAADLSRVISTRRLAALVITADTAFARAVAEEVLTLQPATGMLKPSGGWRSWFGNRT